MKQNILNFSDSQKFFFWGHTNNFIENFLNYLRKKNYDIEYFIDIQEIKKRSLDNTIVLLSFPHLDLKFLEEVKSFQAKEAIILLINSPLKEEQKAIVSELKINYLAAPFTEKEIIMCLENNLEYQLLLKYEILERVVENVPLMLTILNSENKIIWINKAWEESLGWNLQEANEINLLECCYPAPKNYQEEANKTWKDFKIRAKDGKILETSWLNLKLDNGYLMGIGKDIIERKKIDQALEENKSLFRLITENMRDLICIHDLDGNYLYVSPSCQNLLGYEPEELIGKNSYDLCHPDDYERIYQDHTSSLERETTSITYRIRTRSGEYIWLETTTEVIADDLGQPLRLQTISQDVTAKVIVEEQFRRTALYSVLTDLPNRIFLLQHLKVALLESEKDPSQVFAVLIIDLDHFKLINDSVGYDLGDELLIAIGQRLQKLISPKDFLAHLGGDEFAIVLFNIIEREEVFRKTEFIRQQMLLPFNVSGRVLFTSICIGIAMSSSKYKEEEALLRDAQIATSRAKIIGQGNYQLFDQKMYTQIIRRLQLETDLRLAIQKEEFELYYQPIVSIEKKNQLIGFEALLRWKLPNGQRVSPVEFIPVSEDTGLIIPIGEWVLRQACKQLQQWQVKYPHLKDLIISVNLSGRQLREQNLISQLDTILEETGCLAKNLKLEITESILIENAEFVSPLLTELKNRQIQLSLDDFGTGFSSLSYLHRFPVDTLKLDRSFIQKIDEDERTFKIVQAIISLAHKLDMKIVAEGVETEQQLIYLKALECDYIQGYYFSRPLAQLEAETLLEKGLFSKGS